MLIFKVNIVHARKYLANLIWFALPLAALWVTQDNKSSFPLDLLGSCPIFIESLLLVPNSNNLISLPKSGLLCTECLGPIEMDEGTGALSTM